MTAGIEWALKEWAIAVDTLLSGDLILLIRKGGIRESKPYFEVPSDRALLFPTYEHQSVAAIRLPYQARFVPQPVPTIGAPVKLAGWAQITHQLPIGNLSAVKALHPFHIWTDAWFAERLAWKPERPAYGLLLRVYRFAEPLVLSYETRYGGCRSWIAMDTAEYSFPASTAVLSDAAYQERTEAIQQAIAAFATPQA
ncbi:MAG: DUF1802 family protein [Cyanobacteria bacterium J06626_18]